MSCSTQFSSSFWYNHSLCISTNSSLTKTKLYPRMEKLLVPTVPENNDILFAGSRQHNILVSVLLGLQGIAVIFFKSILMHTILTICATVQCYYRSFSYILLLWRLNLFLRFHGTYDIEKTPEKTEGGTECVFYVDNDTLIFIQNFLRYAS